MILGWSIRSDPICVVYHFGVSWPLINTTALISLSWVFSSFWKTSLKYSRSEIMTSQGCELVVSLQIFIQNNVFKSRQTCWTHLGVQKSHWTLFCENLKRLNAGKHFKVWFEPHSIIFDIQVQEKYVKLL